MGLRDDLEHVFLHVLLGRSRGGGTVRYVTEGLRSRTIGLRAGWAHPELEVEVSEARLTEEAVRFLAWVIDYMNRQKARIDAGETMLYGFWQVRWVSSKRKGHLEAWDVVPDRATEYQPRADLASATFDSSWRSPRKSMRSSTRHQPICCSRMTTVYLMVFRSSSFGARS